MSSARTLHVSFVAERLTEDPILIEPEETRIQEPSEIEIVVDPSTSGVRFPASHALDWVAPEVGSAFSAPEVSGDGRRLLFRSLETAADRERRFEFHVTVELEGRSFTSTGYCTIIMEPVGGGG